MAECRCATRRFHDREEFVKLQLFHKQFVKKQVKNYTITKLHFEWKIWLKDGHIRTFFSKIRTFFSVFKKGLERPAPFPPSCKAVCVDEYASISLNLPKYLWECLHDALTMPGLWICLWSSYMFDRLLKIPWVLKVPGFWIRYCCIRKGFPEFWISLNMAQYASIMTDYAFML